MQVNWNKKGLAEQQRRIEMAEPLFSENYFLAVDEFSVFSKFPVWQVLIIVGVISWLYVARLTLLTVRLRSILQPYVTKEVEQSVPFLIRLQGACNPTLDLLLSALSYSVSVEFYTTFLPLLFWAGYPRLARNMVLLMALCMYLGNCLKDIVSAPRPPSPPVRKLLATHAEEESAQEYGLPSSHTINSLCCAGFLLYDICERDISSFWSLGALTGILIFGVLYGRLYLGMHSPVDVIVGVVMGTGILLVWCSTYKYLDAFIAHGENVPSFWAAIAVLLLFAYPTPERQNPSYEFHTAFNGVAFGMVAAVNRTFSLYHHDAVQGLSLISIVGLRTLVLRLLVGLPLCLAVKALTKELAIRILPSMCNLLGLQIRSSSYIKAFYMDEISLKENKKTNGDASDTVDSRRSGYLLRFLQTFEDEILDVDTGIRVLQYASLGWSVFELAPQVYSYLNL
jgi:membrane-associated phospholipid phosphatase